MLIACLVAVLLQSAPQQPPTALLLRSRFYPDSEATIDRFTWSPTGDRAFYVLSESRHTGDLDSDNAEQAVSLCTYDSTKKTAKSLYTGFPFRDWVDNPAHDFDALKGTSYYPNQPRWSPDGSRVLFFLVAYGVSINADGTQLLSADPATGKVRVLSQGWRYYDKGRIDVMLDNGDESIVFSPDRRTLLLVIGAGRFLAEEKRIGTMSFPNGSRTWLTGTTTACTDPSWSPDGERIAYVSNPEFAKGGRDLELREKWALRRIWIMGKDGNGKRQVTNDPGYADFAPEWTKEGRIRFRRQTVLPDGEIDFSGPESSWEVNLDGTGLHRID